MKRIYAMILPCILMVLVGCASITDGINTEKMLIQVAVGKVIENGATDEARQERAERVIEFAADARDWFKFESGTLADLHGLLTERVDSLTLSPTDHLLATAVIDQVILRLNDRRIDGVPVPVPPDYVYRVDQVFQWVESVATLYVSD